MNMDAPTFSYFQELMNIAITAGDTREAVEQFLAALRQQFVFDNVAVYLQDEKTGTLEIAYARAVGRAKNAEADADWGETFASQVLAKGRLLLKDPETNGSADDRLSQAYLLGIPLSADRLVRGALGFVRFAGPADEQDHIDLQPTLHIHGVGVCVAQVFDILFMNAIKYAPGSAIDVFLHQVHEKMVVEFKDHGPGIPKESLPLIFERFYRARSEKATGTGLGLFICKQIIDAHRGKIWAESTLGQGTTFSIE